MKTVNEVIAAYRAQHSALKNLDDDGVLEIMLIEIAQGEADKDVKLINGVGRGPDGKVQFELNMNYHAQR